MEDTRKKSIAQIMGTCQIHEEKGGNSEQRQDLHKKNVALERVPPCLGTWTLWASLRAGHCQSPPTYLAGKTR